jgi:hypothetical protein
MLRKCLGEITTSEKKKEERTSAYSETLRAVDLTIIAVENQ